MEQRTYFAFAGVRRIAFGDLRTVLLEVYEHAHRTGIAAQPVAPTAHNEPAAHDAPAAPTAHDGPDAPTAPAAPTTHNVLVFRADTGRQVDFDLSGTREEVLARALPPEPRKGPGRPRIGVECGEVCLMPRHWEWLDRQPKRASATLRRLIEDAMKNMTPEERARERTEAVHTFMWAVAGDLPGFEEASRALYAGKREVFDALIAPWPKDIVTQIKEML